MAQRRMRLHNSLGKFLFRVTPLGIVPFAIVDALRPSPTRIILSVELSFLLLGLWFIFLKDVPREADQSISKPNKRVLDLGEFLVVGTAILSFLFLGDGGQPTL